MKEANIVSFKVFLDANGILMTEYATLPRNKITKVFSGSDLFYIERILNKLDTQFRNLHDEITEELQALN